MHSVNFQFNSNENKAFSEVDNLMSGLYQNPYFQEMYHGKTMGLESKSMAPSLDIPLNGMTSKDTLSQKSIATSKLEVSLSSSPPKSLLKKEPKLTANPVASNITAPTCTTVTDNHSATYTEPSKLRISTMTAICSSDFTVDLELLYNNITFDEIDTSKPYVQSCQYGSRPTKGLDVKVKQKRTKPKKKKDCFQNQATVIINLADGNKVNLKIFRNGKLQMTGLKSQEGGTVACQTLITRLQQLSTKEPNLVTFHSENPIPNNFNIVLINSDFSVGFKIKRDELYHILFNRDIFVSYEPDIYPGVNAKYYYNSFNNYSGICNCTKPCDGKGDGNGDGCCKKVTIATFQSGNIIITGARNNQQTEAAYQFINNLFREHFHEIVRVTNQETPAGTVNSKKVVVKISDIMNYQVREKILKAMSKKK